jgi:hypothetical protein
MRTFETPTLDDLRRKAGVETISFEDGSDLAGTAAEWNLSRNGNFVVAFCRCGLHRKDHIRAFGLEIRSRRPIWIKAGDVLQSIEAAISTIYAEAGYRAFSWTL